MTYVKKTDAEIKAMSNEEFRNHLREAAKVDAAPGGSWEQKIASAKANPPAPPAGPVKAIVSFSPKFSSGDES